MPSRSRRGARRAPPRFRALNLCCVRRRRARPRTNSSASSRPPRASAPFVEASLPPRRPRRVDQKRARRFLVDSLQGGVRRSPTGSSRQDKWARAIGSPSADPCRRREERRRGRTASAHRPAAADSRPRPVRHPQLINSISAATAELTSPRRSRWRAVNSFEQEHRTCMRSSPRNRRPPEHVSRG
jgi:hypothetical protein